MSKRLLILAPALLLLLAVPAPVRAGVDIDFGASVDLGDDASLYFAISSRYFERDRAAVERLSVRYEHPDDLAVSLQIARYSGREPEAIFRLRREGLTWWEISLQLGVPSDVWFVETRRDPGPPYGKAYGYWKKHRGGREHEMALSDVEVRHLMAVRMIHEYYGISVEAAMELRAGGGHLPRLLSTEYEKRHGKKGQHWTDHPGQGAGKNKQSKSKKGR